MLCAICYHLYILKNAKIAHGGVLLLLVLIGFLNCTDRTKSGSVSYISQEITFSCDLIALLQVKIIRNIKLFETFSYTKENEQY